MGSLRLRVLPKIKEILVVISYKAGCSMKTVSCTLNQLDITIENQKMARKSPPRIGTNLEDWP